MATDVKPATAASAADVIGSFARNQQRRERNLDKIVFATDKTLEGKTIVDTTSQQPVSYEVIFSAFNTLSDKTSDVQQAIESGAVISNSLQNAHVTLQARISSVAENVKKAAVQTGVVQAEKPASTSRLPSLKKVAIGTAATAAVGAVGAGTYIYRNEIQDLAVAAWAKAPSRQEIADFVTENFSSIRDKVSYAGTYVGTDTLLNASTPVKIAVGAGAAAVALGAVVYRKKIGNGALAVAKGIASPFVAGFNGLKNKFKSARSTPVADTAALPAAPQPAVKTA